MRIFVLPVGVLTDLKRGAPDLADALARPLFYREDPELHVVREEHDNEPTTWKIVVESESTWEEAALDTECLSAMRVAIGLLLVELIEGITRDHPWVMSEMNIEGMVVELLAHRRQRAS